MQIATYTGLFWGAVVQGEVAGPFRDFLRSAGAAAHLGRIPYQTWRLESGELCIGLPLAEFPPVPDGLVASSQAIRSIPARWLADERDDEARRDFLLVRQVAAQHGVLLPPGEPLMVTPFRATEPDASAPGNGLEAREGVFLECLWALAEFGVTLMAVRVPDEWGMESPYWTPHHLIEIITGEAFGGGGTVPLEEYGEAPACIVLVQDTELGVFAEIHCKCGAGEGALTRLLVVDVLANAEAREWLHSREACRWLNVTLSVVAWGLLSW